MNSTQQIDELVKEYLLFRGFTNSYKTFEADCRVDKDKGFQAEKIIEELFSQIAAFDLAGLLDYWRYLDLRYFSRLDNRFTGSIKKFELCLLRYYLVYVIQHKKREKLIEFFDTHGADLQGNPEWVRWFAMPFLKRPETDPEFELFFSKAWLDTFTVSLHNFLSTVFQHMPLPSLLCFNVDRLHRKALQTEVENLQNMIESLRKEIQASDQEIALLRDHHQAALKKVSSGLRRRRAASMVDTTRPDTAGLTEEEAAAAAARALLVKSDTVSSLESRLSAAQRFGTHLGDDLGGRNAGGHNNGEDDDDDDDDDDHDGEAGISDEEEEDDDIGHASGAEDDLGGIHGHEPHVFGSTGNTGNRRIRSASSGSQVVPTSTVTTSILVKSSNKSSVSMEQKRLRRLAREARPEESLQIQSQETFLEHQSGITHAKFSRGGTLIASSDMDNVVRIWSFDGSHSMVPVKITNPTCQILSLEWETRDRYVFLGTDEAMVKCFGLEARMVVHEIRTDPKYPRVCMLAYSPVEPVLVAVIASANNQSCALVSVNMKTRATDHVVNLGSGTSNFVRTVSFNHNGQLLVTGDSNGWIRIYDIRSLSKIMEWSCSEFAILSATFSFDETFIQSIDSRGQLWQHSVHKPGVEIDSFLLQGYLTSTVSSAMLMATTTSSGNSIRSTTSLRSRTFNTRKASTSSGSGVPAVMTGSGSASGGGAGTGTTGRSMSSTSISKLQFDLSSSSPPSTSLAAAGGGGAGDGQSSALMLNMNITPSQLLSWSGDTDHLVMGCGNAGVIVQANTGKQVNALIGHSLPLTCVDWSSAGCLTGSADGTIRICKLGPKTKAK